MEGITEEDCRPLEEVNRSYRDLFVKGQQLYGESKFEEMIETFEASLKEFYKELEKCRLATDATSLTNSFLNSYGVVLEMYENLKIQCRP